MLNLAVSNDRVVVSSRTVAEKFGKEHKDVLEASDKLLKLQPDLAAEFSATNFEDGRGKEYRQYLLSRKGFSLLVMRFTGKRALEWQIKFYDAFDAMEAELLKRNLSLPALPTDPIEMMTLVLESAKKERALRLVAEQTKAEIGSRREATAMATASAAVRQLKAAQRQESEQDWWAAARVGGKYRKLTKGIPYKQIGFELAALSREMGVDIQKIPDPRYETVNSYHVSVVQAYINKKSGG